MFTTRWSTSERKYDVIVERDVKVPMPDGTLLDGGAKAYDIKSCQHTVRTFYNCYRLLDDEIRKRR